MKVIKRDGSTVDFDRAKIVVAIQKANQAVEEQYRIDEASIDAIADAVASKGRQRLLVEDIQDMVETKLMAAGKYELAKAYIIYRYTRALVRKANTTDESILALIRNDNKDLAEENSNKNTAIASLTRAVFCDDGAAKFPDGLKAGKTGKARRRSMEYLRELPARRVCDERAGEA